jgi:F-type H+-transporting ATPase subunit a
MRGVTSLFSFIQDHAAAVQESAAAVQQHVPDAAPHGQEFGTEEMIHHIVDSNVVELPFGIEWHLPHIDPIHVGALTIDISPTKHVVFLAIAGFLTVLTMWVAARQAAKLDHGAKAPRGILNGIEAFYLYLRDDVAMANIGRGGERFVPLVITLFFFILYANLLGLVPWGATATSNISVTAALALVALIVIEVAGMRALGTTGYLGTIFYVPKGLNPIMAGVMLVIMTPVEVIGKLAKPFALAVRLFANMTAGHFVILALMGLILTYGAGVTLEGVGPKLTGGVAIFGALSLGLFVMFLEIFVAFLQAYIFAMLTAVFIGLIRHAH